MKYNSTIQLFHNQEDIMNTSTKILPEYKLFLPAKIGKNGGEVTLTLVSGNKLICKVVPEISNGSRQELRKGTDICGFVSFYHLWSQSTNYRHELTKCIDSFNVKTTTRKLLEQTISSLIDSEKPTLNIAILDLLDYGVLSKKKIGVMSSEEDKEFHKRYTIATQYARIKLLDDVVEKSLQQSTLDHKIRGVWQLVKLQNLIDDWDSLKKLDKIIFNAKLPKAVQAYYSKASLLVKTVTTDLWVLRVIQIAFQNNNEQLNDYANEWHQIREGKADFAWGLFVDESKRKQTRDNLDCLVLTSDIPKEAKIIYQLVRNGEVRNNKQEIQDLSTLEEQFKIAKKRVEDATKIYSKAENIAVVVGAKAGTGVAIGALSGAAQVTATLAWLGGGSVACGGLGMIGGLAVLTGGAALLGAVTVFSMASLMGGMDKEEKKFAAVGAVGGLGVGAGVAWGVWSVALASSSYSGAAAITSTLAMFGGGSLAAGGLGMSGGLMVITGGAAAIAIVAGASLNWFLNEKNRENIVKQLEEQAIKTDKELSDLGVQALNY